MNTLYLSAGAALFIFGIWLTLNQIKAYKAIKRENPKSDYKGIGVGIICIILGIIVILRFIK